LLALLFALASESWWASLSEYHQLTEMLKSNCEQQKGLAENTTALTEHRAANIKLAEKINRLWLAKKKIEVLSPCDTEQL
jgi:hypothetical protein